MESSKIYTQSMGTLLDTINDIVELQNGKLTFSDTSHGKIYFTISMYAFRWEVRFAVADLGDNRCKVSIGVNGEKRGREKLQLREFALLDSMLAAGTQIEIADSEDDG